MKGTVRNLLWSAVLVTTFFAATPQGVFASCCYGGDGSHCCGACCSASPNGCQAGKCPA